METALAFCLGTSDLATATLFGYSRRTISCKWAVLNGRKLRGEAGVTSQLKELIPGSSRFSVLPLTCWVSLSCWLNAEKTGLAERQHYFVKIELAVDFGV